MGNKQSSMSPSLTRHYFVDEGGDGTLFSRKGKILVGTEGCSRFFILGLLDVSDPIVLEDRLDQLRGQLMNDSYFKSVPSMQPVNRKTALAFHAKDDLPEVRRDVFRWKAFGLVHDIDDTSKTDYGVYYTQNRPLTAAALKERK